MYAAAVDLAVDFAVDVGKKLPWEGGDDLSEEVTTQALEAHNKTGMAASATIRRVKVRDTYQGKLRPPTLCL